MDTDSEYVAIPIDNDDLIRKSIAEDFQYGLNELEEKNQRCINYKYTIGCLVLITIIGVVIFVFCHVILKL